jgi:glutamate/tyrosine decarboxylase-like PLP-dependent enzyme
VETAGEPDADHQDGVDALDALERASSPLDPDADLRAIWSRAVLAHTERLLAGVDGDPAYRPEPPGGSMAALAAIGVPDRPRDVDDVLADLLRWVDQPGVATTSPRYLGYVPGGGLYASALGDLLAAVSNRYAALASVSPGAAALETVVTDWLAGVVGFGPGAAGVLTSGGTQATLTAVVAARDATVPGPAGGCVVYATAHAHHALDQALAVAGLGGVVRRTVALDARYRMDAAALRAAVAADRAAGLRPWLLAATAGTTSTGAVDPLDALADVAADEDMWFHVDGAYGALFRLCAPGRAVLVGIERADTVVLDPHKTMFLPYGTGAVLARRGRRLRDVFAVRTDYLVDDDPGAAGSPRSPADHGPELTRHFRALRVWLPLQLAGRDALAAALTEKIELARYLHRRLEETDGFEVGPAPDLSILTYRYAPAGIDRGDAVRLDALNQALVDRVRLDGEVFVTTTRLDGRLVLRAAVGSFRTHRRHVDRAVDALVAAAGSLGAGGAVGPGQGETPRAP